MTKRKPDYKLKIKFGDRVKFKLEDEWELGTVKDIDDSTKGVRGYWIKIPGRARWVCVPAKLVQKTGE